MPRTHSVRILSINWRNQSQISVPVLDSAGGQTYNPDGSVITETKTVYDPTVLFRATIEDGGIKWVEEMSAQRVYQLTGDYTDQRRILDLTQAEMDTVFSGWLQNLDTYLNQAMSDSEFLTKKTQIENFMTRFTESSVIAPSIRFITLTV
jgi:hypothetical protein